MDADKPNRGNTWPLSFFLDLKPGDTAAEPFQHELAGALIVMRQSPLGRRLLDKLEQEDIQFGGLQKGQAFGYYLAADRALYTQTSKLLQALQTIAHEARHAEQTVAGHTTITEFHQPGTKLPFDTKSYLKLNRVLEADADATALAVIWEVSNNGPEHAGLWAALQKDAHFGPMAARFEEAAKQSGYPPFDDRAVRTGMKAAFQTWPKVGEPLRSEGYDDQLMAWLEVQASAWEEPVYADKAFGMADARLITNLGNDAPYWKHDEDPETTEAFERFESRFDDRFAAMGAQLKPANGLVIDASAVQQWQQKRGSGPKATVAQPVAAPTP